MAESVGLRESPLPTVSSVDEALEIIRRHIAPLAAEEVDLTEAGGRVLAHDVTAPSDLWPFARSAMDGYAVRAEDLAVASPDAPVRLAVAGALFAGSAKGPPVAAGTAARIATGAPIPAGADAVMPHEQVQVHDDSIIVTRPVPAGKHIFPAGEDARKGEVVLPAGTALRGGSLALLASLGVSRVAVVRRPRVAILAVGDELVAPDETPQPGQVREGNSYALAAEVRAVGGEPQRLGIARDDLAEIVPRIRLGLEVADAVIVCAGMSVGERDLVREALRLAGVRLVFWRVPMKPGAPAAFGVAGSIPVFGLPGNPGAAMAVFEELVRPALCALAGRRLINRPWLPAMLDTPLNVTPGRRRYLWARVAAGPDGLTATLLRGQGTATLRSLSDANALVFVPPETASLRPGDRVVVQLLADVEAGEADAGRIPVLAVVGAKRAGKTALIEQLLPELRRRGYRVGVLKHDAHGFTIDHKGTDTWRFTAAGAEAVVIAGPEQVALMRRAEAPQLHHVLALVGGVDLILVEGFSQEPVPKVEVRRAGIESDKPPPAGPLLAVAAAGDGAGGAVVFDGVPALVDQIERDLPLRPPHRGVTGAAADRPRP